MALAKRGFNNVLLGHKEEELQTAQQTITEAFPNAKTRIIIVDAITATPNRISDLMQELKDLNLTILVNNIGGIPTVRSQYYNRIDTISAQLLQQTVALNAGFMAQLTRVAIPCLSRNGPSLILNVVSASLLGFPGAATYSGKKAFVTAFSKAVTREMKADGLPIDVTVAMLGEVRTQANPVVPFGSLDAEAFGEAMIANVGRAIQTQRLVYHPWFGHAIQDFVMDAIPTYLLEWILKQVFNEKGRVRGNKLS
ncbi:hypothetical protein NW762_006127 [Fusarium torreyae]|uniref:Uncharacterized protein n=1 Tax=Fusarium torreyae TaxID=1237075 RepID=A0A9W8RZY3_9HYPO|nr:hypothetical protein NW762_006127 [Fusarium torreyae]